MLAAMTTPKAACAVGRPLYFLSGRRAENDISMKDVRSILVVRPDEIGNVVLATPFLRELRRIAGSAWITLVVKPEVLNLVELCPYVNEIVTFDWNVSGAPKRHSRALRLAATRLWGRRFDLAVLPRLYPDLYHSTYLTYFSGASRRVGYSEHVFPHKQQINAGFDRMLTHVLSDTSVKHEVEHNLGLIRFLGGVITEDRLELWLDPRDRTLALQLISQHGIEAGDCVMAIAPGASLAKKRWPVERFVELGRLLVREYGARLIIVGGPRDNDRGLRLETELGSSNV